MPDRFDLQRFADAQTPVWNDVLSELRAGRKRSHWMWFVFPQITGLGQSPTARFYAIASLAEAQAYLAHALLGVRLVECTQIVNAVDADSAHDIFGSPDELKFRSSMTLFSKATGPDSPFQIALDRYFDSAPDQRTLDMMTA